MSELASRHSGPTMSTFRSFRTLAIAIPLVLVLMAMVAALFLVGGVEDQLGDIARAQQVRQQARDLLQGLVDAESGQRGYLLTQDADYLTPYKAAGRTIDTAYQSLVTMVDSEPEARANLKRLDDDIEAKRQEMATTISLVDSGQKADAINIVNSDAGRALMDRIRAEIGEFTTSEDNSLATRNGQVAGYREALIAAILVALAGAAALGVALFTRGQQQVGELSRRQTALMDQTQQLEEIIKTRTADLEEARMRAERERARVETLLQDTNHRIGNSLAIVSSLLGLQVTRSKSEQVRAELEAAQSRVQSIASGYRRLRLGPDLATVNAGEFLESVVDDLAATVAGGSIRLTKDCEPIVVPARDATTLGIIVNELVTNAIKHAFDGRSEGEIEVGLRRDEAGVPILTVSDDGTGMGESPSPSGLGAMIIRQLVRQYGGDPDYRAREGGGTIVVMQLAEL